MSQYKFANQNGDKSDTTDNTHMQSFSEATDTILSIIVRLCGLILLFIGLWIAIQVFNEALALYKDPGNIERVAVAIENGSNIDKSLAPLKQTLMGDDLEPDASIAQTKTSATINSKNNMRVSYFIAWVVQLLLLILLARISLMAVKTGGELALYDSQVKKLARQLGQNNRKSRD